MFETLLGDYIYSDRTLFIPFACFILYNILYIFSFILSSSACNASVCAIIRFLVNTPTILVLKISNYIIIIDYVCFLNMVSMMFMYVCVSFLNVSKPGQNFNCQILYIITKDRILRHQNTNYSIPTIIFFVFKWLTQS